MCFLDFRVLPLKNRDKEVLTSYGWLQPSERTRLIPSSGEDQGLGLLQRYMDSGDAASILASNYYSSLATSENYDEDDSIEGGDFFLHDCPNGIYNPSKVHDTRF